MYEYIEKVYEEHYQDLSRYLAKHCHSIDIIDDIIQNTFLEALKSIEGFKGRSSMKTWLFGIAKHQLYRHYRKNKIKINIDELSETAHAIETDFSDKLLAEQVLETINELPPPRDEIMRLRLVHELSFKEIGLRVGQTENYCRVNYYRMKEMLRREYDHENM